MAADRIGKESAELVTFPLHTWKIETIGSLLDAEVVSKELRYRIPVNTPLMHSIHGEGFKNPVLLMKNGWPIAGGQRLRVCQKILKKNPDWNCAVHVCQLTQDDWNWAYLWPEIEFRDKMIAVYFQMIELVFKSKYYNFDKAADGTEMTYYEELGDRMKWNHKGK